MFFMTNNNLRLSFCKDFMWMGSPSPSPFFPPFCSDTLGTIVCQLLENITPGIQNRFNTSQLVFSRHGVFNQKAS